jgi:hypothetical protein
MCYDCSSRIYEVRAGSCRYLRRPFHLCFFSTRQRPAWRTRVRAQRKSISIAERSCGDLLENVGFALGLNEVMQHEDVVRCALSARLMAWLSDACLYSVMMGV